MSWTEGTQVDPEEERARRVPKALGWILALVVVAGCEPQSADGDLTVTIDTVAGTVVTTNVLRPGGEPPAFSLREIWRTGAVAPEPGEELAGPFIAIAIGRSGRVAVLDQTLASVAILDGTTGRFMHRIARAGRGPGELGGPVALTWDDSGRLWVQDQMNRRYSVYDSLGGYRKSFPRPSRSANRRVVPMLELSGRGLLLDHDVSGSALRVFTVDTLGSFHDTLRVEWPDRGGLSGFIRPGSAVQEAVHFLPSLRWTFARDGSAVWTTRSDSLTLAKISLAGDTILRVSTTHRRASFTAAQEATIAQAERELGRSAPFVPMLVQAVYGMEDGRLLAQIGRDPFVPGRELDLFGSDGVLLGTIHAPFAIHHRSELASRGDTLVVHAVGEMDVPIIVKAVIEPAGGGALGSR